MLEVTAATGFAAVANLVRGDELVQTKVAVEEEQSLVETKRLGDVGTRQPGAAFPTGQGLKPCPSDGPTAAVPTPGQLALRGPHLTTTDVLLSEDGDERCGQGQVELATEG